MATRCRWRRDSLSYARAVAGLVAEAAARLGLPEPEVRTLGRAGLVHDFGRLGLSNAIWDKAGPLGAGEWERVRIHPYLTERMLHQSGTLAPLAAIAVAHRERLDGPGYPRGLLGSAISRPARVIAAADAYQAIPEPRPYRTLRQAERVADAYARLVVNRRRRVRCRRCRERARNTSRATARSRTGTRTSRATR